MKKKIILLAICLFSVFAFFTACNGDKKQTQTGTSTGERDFGGRKFYYRGTVITADPSDDDPDIDPGTLPYMESREDEVLYNQCLYIEKTYNCKIIRSGFPGNDTQSFATMFASGDVEADFCSATFGDLREYHKAGILCNMEELKSLDSADEEKWGIEAKRDATRYGGVLYAFPVKGSMYTPFVSVYSGALIYNYELYNEFNIGTTPKEMVEAGDWNFDTFLNIIQRCSDLTAQRPIYGLQNDCSLPSSAIDANGSNTIIMRNGKYVCGYSSDASINALEWVRKMNQTGCIGGNIDNDTAVFALKTSEKAINTKCSTVHWVPFPTGPDATDATKNTGAYFGYHEFGTSVFKHANDSQRDEDSAYILDKLFAPTEEWGKTGYDEYMSRNFFDTVEDYEVYKYASINMSYQYAAEIVPNKEFSDSMSSVIDGAVAASFTGSIKNQLSSLVTAMNEQICKPMNEAK